MTGRYAQATEVPVERTRAEIEAVLAKYGADAFGSMMDGRHARIAFRMAGRHYRFALTLPDPAEDQFNIYHQGRSTFRRTASATADLYAQACRSLWRALLLVIKAKLEAAAIGITSLEDEFMAAMVLSDGATVGETMGPQLADHYRLGGPPRLMLEARP